jgi:hypothetical protein
VQGQWKERLCVGVAEKTVDSVLKQSRRVLREDEQVAAGNRSNRRVYRKRPRGCPARTGDTGFPPGRFSGRYDGDVDTIIEGGVTGGVVQVPRYVSDCGAGRGCVGTRNDGEFAFVKTAREFSLVGNLGWDFMPPFRYGYLRGLRSRLASTTLSPRVEVRRIFLPVLVVLTLTRPPLGMGITAPDAP